MYTENALMFPHRAIVALRSMRGHKWQVLCDRVLNLPETHEDTLAFMLMMIRLNGCMSCETDSYRAMRGCASCAQQTLRRYKGDDDDLLAAFEVALRDVRHFAAGGPPLSIHSDSDLIEIQ